MVANSRYSDAMRDYTSAVHHGDHVKMLEATERLDAICAPRSGPVWPSILLILFGMALLTGCFVRFDGFLQARACTALTAIVQNQHLP